jgi:hypothetical protein
MSSFDSRGRFDGISVQANESRRHARNFELL